MVPTDRIADNQVSVSNPTESADQGGFNDESNAGAESTSEDDPAKKSL